MPSSRKYLRNLEGIPSLMYTRSPPDRPVTSLCNRAFVKEQSSFVSAMTRISMGFSKRSSNEAILSLIYGLFEKITTGWIKPVAINQKSSVTEDAKRKAL